MKQAYVLVLSALAFPGVLPAQAVVGPQKPLEPAKVEVRDALVGVRDTLIRIQAAVSQLERGPAEASDALLRSRARTLAVSCEQAVGTLPAARAIVAKGTWDGAYPKRRQRELLQHFDRLTPILETCGSEWRSMTNLTNTATLRDKGVGRAKAVRQATMDFQQASETFLLSIDVRVRPKGAGASPIP